jgi:uncharacterized protein
MKKFFLFLASFLLLISSCKNKEETTQSENKIFPPQTAYVNDFEKIMTPHQVSELELIIKDFEQKTTNEIVIVTTDSIIPYEDILDFGRELSSEWAIGKKDKNNGMLIALSKKLRKVGISSGEGTQAVLTDQFCKELNQDMVIEFKKGDYFGGLKKAVLKITATWKE